MLAIESSRISIIVFSKTYAESSWCLKELEQIMKCRRNCGQVVVPIFHDVDPSALRHQTGSYGIALQTTAKRRSSAAEMMEDEFSNWNSTLTEAANISGWHDKNFKNEAELISQIVGDVKRKLDKRLLNITEYPVGLDAPVQQVIQFIENQSNKVCLIGIWGMGGSGKTTLAGAIYNKFYCKFVDHSFIENIREVCNRGDEEIIHLQEQLLSNLLKTNEKIYNAASGKATLKNIFKVKKALIVLDDVSTSEQVETLCGNRKYFVSGSVLIVTSRDVHILKKLKVDYIYSIKEMDEIKSLELFSWHAFGQPRPIEGFSELSEKIVACCGGLPLALEVIGSSLSERTRKAHWTCTLSKLRRIPNDRVLKTLKISYDGLKDDLVKDIFLDICCFFIGKDISYVTEILNGCGLFADAGIADLIDQSLLKVEKNSKLGMHDLLRDMGREIVKRSTKKLGKRSRLWFHEDVREVLNGNSGTDSVEGLVLKSQSNMNVSFKADSFMEMKKLRLLQLNHVDLTGDYVHLSQKLRWLHWQGFTDDCIPDSFYQKNLVVFELKHSNIKQLWNETKLMGKLKILNLSYSKHLTCTPDFSKLPNLEKLIMKDCSSLSELHHSIGDLENILLINLKDCTSLRNLPEKVYQLKSLKTLILSGCSKIDKLEEDIKQMEPWTNGTGVKEILYSIQGLKRITYICGCQLSFEVFPSVSWSRMSSTMEFPPCISPFDNHYDINFRESETSPNSNLSLRSLLIGMGSCHIVTDTLGKSIPQGLITNYSGHFSFPGGKYHSWSATGEGPSARFQVPENIDCQVKGIILCVAYSSTPKNMGAECLTNVLIINYTKFTVHIYKRDTLMSFNYEDWKGLTSNLGHGDDVQICLVFGHGLIVKETTVYLIYGQSATTELEKSMEVEPSTNMEIEEVNVQLSPEVDRQPSPDAKLEASIIMEIEHSISVRL
ncbi:unnamed protein product [Trifolium pratense]|uniref:Uncharacterized protein n=1 Tax=Trifolium pratense TaxID=57577 RepID=A0ACB0IS63_TRIPR|nr:unnamed protein product [Trifolium pratense]